MAKPNARQLTFFKAAPLSTQLKRERESGEEEEVRSFWGPKPLDGKCYVIVFKTYSLSQVEGKKDGHCQRVLPLFHIEPMRRGSYPLSLASDTHHNFLLLLFWLLRRRELRGSIRPPTMPQRWMNEIWYLGLNERNEKVIENCRRRRCAHVYIPSVMATSCCPECNGNLCT